MTSGFLILDKDEGMTCRQIDNLLQHEYGTKVGHLGTLDPFATGLLIVALGEATKLLNLIDDEYKTYRADLILGKETDTLDVDGTIVKEEPVSELDEAEIRKALASFIGEGEQIPPRYSAKHIANKRAYDLAREDVDFTLRPIDIDIPDIRLISFTRGSISFEARVSKGCYIRALGRDIAIKLGTCGYLKELRRTEIGKLTIERAKRLRDIKKTDIIPMEDMFPNIPKIELTESDINRAKNGAPVRLNRDDERVFIMRENRIIALYERREDVYLCLRGFRYED